MQVCLLRHGIAIDPSVEACPSDPERWLTSDGIEKTEAACRGLRLLGVEPQLVLTSPYLRARQTADIAMRVLGLPIEQLREEPHLIPGGDPRKVLHALALTRAESVLCTGHAPSIDVLLAYLTTGRFEPCTALRKAGAALVDRVNAPEPGGELVFLMTPKALRLLGR